MMRAGDFKVGHKVIAHTYDGMSYHTKITEIVVDYSGYLTIYVDASDSGYPIRYMYSCDQKSSMLQLHYGAYTSFELLVLFGKDL